MGTNGNSNTNDDIKAEHTETVVEDESGNNKRKADEITKDEEENPGKSDGDDPMKEDEVTEAAAAVAEAVADSKEDDDDDDQAGDDAAGGKRRFFPRVKHLLTREWEPFLTGVLDSLEQAGAPQAAAASHKLSNPWYKAFDLVYSGVAQGCSIPHGKNRYHKFKDKIVELWVAMEQHASDDHPLKQRSVDQLEEYRKACANFVATPKKEGVLRTPGSVIMRTPADKLSAARRSYGSTFALKWKHLDEAKAVDALPEPLQSMLHIRHLTSELGTDTKTSADLYFDSALQDYLKEMPEGKEALYEKSNCLAVLARLSQSEKETKEITDAYEKVITEYLALFPAPTPSETADLDKTAIV